MNAVESWGKELGWCQTNTSNFWKNGSYNEFVGVTDGYACLLMDWRGKIVVRVFYLAENKEREKEVQSKLRRRHDFLPQCGISCQGNSITLTFGSFFISGLKRLDRAKEALPALVSWLRSNGIRPSAVCACGSHEGLKCFLEDDGAVHIRCPNCASKLPLSAPSTPA